MSEDEEKVKNTPVIPGTSSAMQPAATSVLEEAPTTKRKKDDDIGVTHNGTTGSAQTSSETEEVKASKPDETIESPMKFTAKSSSGEPDLISVTRPKNGEPITEDNCQFPEGYTQGQKEAFVRNINKLEPLTLEAMANKNSNKLDYNPDTGELRYKNDDGSTRPLTQDELDGKTDLFQDNNGNNLSFGEAFKQTANETAAKENIPIRCVNAPNELIKAKKLPQPDNTATETANSTPEPATQQGAKGGGKEDNSSTQQTASSLSSSGPPTSNSSLLGSVKLSESDTIAANDATAEAEKDVSVSSGPGM